MLKILGIVLPLIVVVSGIAMLVTKRFEFMIHYVLLLGGFTVFMGIIDIRKKEVGISTYMRIIIFGVLLVYFIFLSVSS